MMKRTDVTAAVALIIHGYLRSNASHDHPDTMELSEVLSFIQSECDDWAENLAAQGDE